MNIELDRAIRYIVEAFLPKFAPTVLVRGSGGDGDQYAEQGLLFTFGVGLHVVANDDDYSRRSMVNLLIWRPKNYTKVFFAEASPTARAEDLTSANWQLIADHDSCWPNGIASKLGDIERNLRDSLLADLNNEYNSDFSKDAIARARKRFHEPIAPGFVHPVSFEMAEGKIGNLQLLEK